MKGFHRVFKLVKVPGLLCEMILFISVQGSSIFLNIKILNSIIFTGFEWFPDDDDSAWEVTLYIR